MNHSQGRGSVLLPHGTRKDGLNFQPNTTKAAQAETGSFTYGTIRDGANYTKSEAADLPDSEVFAHPEFMVLDVGRACPQGWPQRFGVVVKPHVHSSDLTNQRMVSEFPEGIKTMTTTSTRATAHTTTTPAIPRFSTPATAHHDRLALLQRADNSLAMARWHLRKQSNPEAIRMATGKAVSAARALKQLCTELAGAA